MKKHARENLASKLSFPYGGPVPTVAPSTASPLDGESKQYRATQEPERARRPPTTPNARPKELLLQLLRFDVPLMPTCQGFKPALKLLFHPLLSEPLFYLE